MLSHIKDNPRLERIFYLALFDFKSRYYDSYLGIFWAFLNPMFKALSYYFVFTVFFHNTIENFALHIYSGLIIWIYFSDTTKTAMTVFSRKRYLIEDVQINKADLHLSNILTTTFSFLFNLSVYFVLLPFFDVKVGVMLIFVPILLITLTMLAYAVGVIISLIQTFVKDFMHVWDMIILLWFWFNPVFYGREVIYDKTPWLNYINPVSGIMINFRHSIFTNDMPNIELMILNLATAVALLIISLVALKKYSKSVAEVL